jgi:ABC-2 type transport system ATP-binding protein
MSETKTMISVNGVSKNFILPNEQSSGIKQHLVNKLKGKKGFQIQHTLKNISFEIKKGEFFGIVGRNGSGKSTLLKLLADIYTPDKGSVEINGTLTPFIELGVGFNPELTGRENVFMNGALLGFDRNEVKLMYDDIVKFAELDMFMDQKLKNYSSGMQVRLAFSIAIRAKTDILLIDEVLAVGDAAFQAKCFDYFYELKKSDTTVVFVSHDQGSLERFCDRGVLIDDGEITASGDIKKVLKAYSKIVLTELANATEATSEEETRSDFAQIKNVKAFTDSNESTTKFTFGEKISISYDIKVKREIINPIFGVTVWKRNVDNAILATNTLIDGVNETGTFEKSDTITFSVTLPDNLNDGEYYIEPAIANDSATVFYDKQPEALKIFISGGVNPHSIASFEDKSKFTVVKK